MNASRLLTLGSLALLAAATAPGCATKGDVRRVQSQILALQARQDSIFRTLQRQNRELLDSVRNTTDLLVRVRGDLGHQLLNLEQQLVQVQELTGQGQRRLQELNAQLEQSRRVLAGAPVGDSSEAAPGGAAPGGTGEPGSAAELYAAGQAQLRNGAASTARMAFQQLLRSFPGDSLAAAAQLGIAQSYVQDDPTRALREFDRVVELYPSSPRAPAALLAAAALAQEQGNVTRAREYLRRILARYPRSPEASQARTRLNRLGAAGAASPRRAAGSRKRTTSTRRR